MDEKSHFEKRDKFETFDLAYTEAQRRVGWIVHILKNDDNTFSVMSHINCEWCDYCTASNIAYEAGIRYTDSREPKGYPLVFEAKENPYEEQNKDELKSKKEESGECPVCGKDVLLKEGVLVGIQINGAGKNDRPGVLQLCCNKQCGAAYLLSVALMIHKDVIGVKR